MTDLVFLDFETTGLFAERLERGPQKGRRDEVLEIGIIDAAGRTVINCLVKPVERQTWKSAQKIHGISPNDVADAQTFEAVEREMVRAIEGKQCAIYNAPFDVRFMTEKARIAPAAFICVMQLFRKITDSRNYTLEDATSWANYSVPQDHRAINDVQATLHVWNALKSHVAPKDFDNAVRASAYDPFKPRYQHYYS